MTIQTQAKRVREMKDRRERHKELEVLIDRELRYWATAMDTIKEVYAKVGDTMDVLSDEIKQSESLMNANQEAIEAAKLKVEEAQRKVNC